MQSNNGNGSSSTVKLIPVSNSEELVQVEEVNKNKKPKSKTRKI